MMTRTRYFVVASLLVLSVGVGTGLVAYYVGFPAGAFTRGDGPDELRLLPRSSAVVAYVDVQSVMASEVRQKLHRALPAGDNGQREFQDRTGINIETDIDHIVACLNPGEETSRLPGAGMVVARGRFDEVKIEALMREHGAHVEDYRGKRLVVSDVGDRPTSFAVSFIEPGLVAVGNTNLVKTAVELHQGGDNPQTGLASVTRNEELMNQVKSLDSGNAWAVGRFDALASRARLPQGIAERLPAITWFSVSGEVNGGLRGIIRAEARDEEAANNLRDVVRGFIALGKLQAGSNPQMQLMAQSLELGGTGKTVALSFAVPAEVFDAITTMIPKRQHDEPQVEKPQLEKPQIDKR
jgi:hypothetical protein